MANQKNVDIITDRTNLEYNLGPELRKVNIELHDELSLLMNLEESGNVTTLGDIEPSEDFQQSRLDFNHLVFI